MNHHINSENDFNSVNGITWERLAKYFAGECTDQEQRHIRDWLNADPSRTELLETLRTIWAEGGKYPKQFDAKSIWNKVAVRSKIIVQPDDSAVVSIPSRNRFASNHRPMQYVLRVAAALALLVSVPYAVWRVTEPVDVPVEPTMRLFSTQAGERARFSFSDGTKIWLNAATTVRFPNRFEGNKREIQLDGEAFFEVARNENMPFVVNTGSAVVEVLGTEFNVRARKEDKRVDVVVTSGRVLFQKNDSAQVRKVLLTKGERSVLTEAGRLSAPEQVDVQIYTGWVKGALIFNRTPMKDVVVELERWYGVPCKLADTATGSYQITGTFQTESFDEVLRTISLTTNLKHSRTEGAVVFSQQ